MTLSYQRPVAMETHPIIRRKYIVPTPNIDELVKRVNKQIRLRSPGAILYGYPRFGKTSSIRYVISYLQELYAGAVCINFRCETHKSGSEDAFFCALLSAVGHREPQAGKISRKRARLIECICEMADSMGRDWIVFFADEAQKLQVLEYEWLRDVHDTLERKGIRMITILVGQPQILAQKSSLRQSQDTQIVLRFMVTEMRFGGLTTPEEVATCLNSYDQAHFPASSAWPYTRFFYPRAYSTGLRLVEQANAVWSAFERAHEGAGFTHPLEIPMAYFARTVEHALSEHFHRDHENFRFSAAIWDEAVLESTYVLAFEEIRLGLPLPEWE
jgi:hypothetical protein